MVARFVSIAFQWLENRANKFPIIGKTNRRISNPWKNRNNNFQSLEISPSLRNAICGMLPVLVFALSAQATTYYMDPTGSGDGTTWDEACWSFEELDANCGPLQDGDIILCSNGVYDTGGMIAAGQTLTNRVCLNAAIELRSVNGPDVTFIAGASSGGGCGPRAIRCVYMTNGAQLIGFTITNGWTESSGLNADQQGGGIYAVSNMVVSNCVITGCNAYYDGGGIHADRGFGQIVNCEIKNNTQVNAGGAGGGGATISYGMTMDSCIVSGNVAYGGSGGAGVYMYSDDVNRPARVCNSLIVTNVISGMNIGGGLTMSASGVNGAVLAENCTIVGNTAEYGGGIMPDTGAQINNCIVWNNIAGDSGNDINTMLGGTVNYSCASDGVTHGSDGCITNNPLFTDWSGNVFTLQSSSPCKDTGNNALAPTNVSPNDLAGNPRIADTTVDMGAYEYTTLADTYYVDAAQADDSGDGTSWATAKKTIQAAVDLTPDGGTVWVTNGVYDAGSAVTPGYAQTNRVCITNAITVQSVNGPDVTIIAGAPGSNGSNDVDSIRGVFMSGGCSLIGFSVTNGYTMYSGDIYYDQTAGGVLLEVNCKASNLVVRGNSAGTGGGVFLYNGGTLDNSTMSDNASLGLGGGVIMANAGTANNCVLTGNLSQQEGGGAALYMGGTLNNCLSSDNSATDGGGVYLALGGTVNNCTIISNTASTGVGVYLEGGGEVNNSVIWDGDGAVLNTGGNVRYSCAPSGLTNGVNGCITNNPLFMDADNGDYQLQDTSPCINNGDNVYAPTNVSPVDLAGSPRILDGTVDMGAYEYVEAYYADASQPDDSGDGYSWATAKKTIQAAVDIALEGKTVWVTNGLYNTGSKVTPGLELTNRVCITKAITVQSVNGPAVTIIEGAFGSNGSNDADAVRGVYMTNSCSLSGFTVRDCCTLETGGDPFQEGCGGGIWMSINCSVSNCIIYNNGAVLGGGGIYAYDGGWIDSCTIYSNFSFTAGGVFLDSYVSQGGTLIRSIVTGNEGFLSGGGVYLCENCRVDDCVIVSNSVLDSGGGLFLDQGGVVTNCLIAHNEADYGGGALIDDYQFAEIEHCTIRDNYAYEAGGGIYLADNGMVNNCLIYSNSTDYGGGGAVLDWGGSLNSCLIYGNSSTTNGGGGTVIYDAGDINNCTIYGNDTPQGDGGGSALIDGGSMNNCIIWGNTAPASTNKNIYREGSASYYYTCSSDGIVPGAFGCITNDPQLINGPHDLRLRPSSPCFNAGDNSYVYPAITPTDMAGEPRISFTTVDIGAYELSYQVSTANGPHDGGNTITITNIAALGDGADITNVTVGGAAATIVDQGTDWVTITLGIAADNDTSGDILIQSTTVGDTTLAGAYRYNPKGFIGNEAGWQNVAGLPVVLDTGNAVVYSNRLYSVGGTVAGSSSTNVYRFDGTNWMPIVGIPGPRRAMGCVVYNGLLYAIGGIDASSIQYTNVYTFDGTSWSEAVGLPYAVCEMGCAVWNGKIYCIAGGGGGSEISSVCSFDGTSWSMETSLPGPRTAIQAQTLNGTLYALGGYDDPSAYTNVWTFDGSSWTEVVGYPSICCAAGTTVRDGLIYSMGGTGAGGHLTNGWTFDGTAWTEIEGLPRTLYAPAAATFNAQVYCVGGYNSGVGSGTTNVMTYPSYTGGVSPANCSVDGGVQVTINGVNLGDGSDITNVTLCGVEVTSIDSQNGTQVVVTAAAGTPSKGDVNVYSTGYGVTIKVDGFSYYRMSTNTGPAMGGNTITITNGTLGSASDITNVTVCGSATTILDQGDNWVQVMLGASTNVYLQITGDIVIQSTVVGNTIYTDAYTYNRGIGLTFYADSSKADDSGDGFSWATAKKTIQAAVDLALDGDSVLVTNGTYDTGGAVTPGFGLTNRVYIDKAIDVHSVNGPDATIISGALDPGTGGRGNAAIRGVLMTNGCSLAGFTITNGFTRQAGDIDVDQCGGGLWITTNCVASNLVISSNAAYYGGGVYLFHGGTLADSTLSKNSAVDGGGAYLGYGGLVENCSVVENHAAQWGAGAYSRVGCPINRCSFRDNSSQWQGGGAFLYASTLNNCLLTGNTASDDGGGAFLYYGTANNCTMSDNNSGADGGGAFLDNGTVNNCIIFGNTASGSGNDLNVSSGNTRYSCASDGLTNDVNGNITNAPLYMDSAGTNYHLQLTSPCLNAGDNGYAQGAYDLAENTRIMFSTVDMGAYEVQFMLSAYTGPLAGGNTLTITNGALGSGSDITNVLVGGTTATITGQGIDWVTITVPAASATGSVNVLVQSLSQGETLLQNAYTYNPAGEITVPNIMMEYLISFTGTNGTSFDYHMNETYVTNYTLMYPGGIVYTYLSATNPHSVELAATNRGELVKNDVWMRLDGFEDSYNGGWNDMALSLWWLATNAGQWFAFRDSFGDSYVTFTNLPGTNYEVEVINAYGAITLRYNQQLHPGIWQPGDARDIGNWGTNVAIWQQPRGGGNWFSPTNTYWWRDRYIVYSNAVPQDRAMTLVLWDTNGLPCNVLNAMRIRGEEPLGKPVNPDAGSWTGGYQIVISGENLGSGTDITNVAICGVTASSIDSQSASQVVVTASTATGPVLGDVSVFSTSYGKTTESNSFTYLAGVMGLLGTNNTSIASGDAANQANGTAFCPTLPGSAQTNTFRITNSGNDVLVFDSTDLSDQTDPTPFSVPDLPATVEAGGISNFSVVFSPLTAGSYSLGLSLTNNSPASPFLLNLAGACYDLSTNVGPYAGGNTITITNGALGSGSDITNVLVGGVAATITGQGANWVTITLPEATASGTVSVRVQSVSQGETLLEDAYTYNPAGTIEQWIPGPDAWTNAHEQLYTDVHALKYDGQGHLYVGGNFTNSSTMGAHYFAMWDGDSWTNLGEGMDSAIRAMAMDTNGLLYVGGAFTTAGGISANRIACYDTINGTWTNLSYGMNNAVWALAVGPDNELYAGGLFSTAGGVSSRYVSKWNPDTRSWSSLGTGLNAGYAMALAVDSNGLLYVGGGFTNAGSASDTRYLAMWDPNAGTWTNLGPTGANAYVDALELDDAGNLYVGGRFTTCCGISANRIAKLAPDGTWTNLGSGMNSYVFALGTGTNNNLYAGGGFTTAGGVPSRFVASCDLTSGTWTNLGLGVNNQVFAMEQGLDGVYAGGWITTAGVYQAAGLGRFADTIVELSGVAPSSGSWTGGYPVVITGSNLCNGSDVTNVTLCGFDVSSIASQSDTQITVIAGSTGAPFSGDVVVYSTSFGTTTKSNAFTYLAPNMIVLGTNGAPIASGESASLAKGTAFSPTLFGTAQTNTLSITNNGNDVLVLDPADLSDPTDFTVAGIPATVDIGAVSNFTVTYAPTTMGDHSAFIAFTNNAPDSPFTLNLAGSCFAVSTNNGPYDGGNTVTITNGTLGDGSDITNVLIGGVAATITGQGTDWVTITLPEATASGTVDILVQSASQGETLLENAYTYNPKGGLGITSIQDAWEEMEGLPGSRYNGAMETYEGCLYYAAGYDGSTRTTNVFRYDGTNWSEVAGLPDERNNCEMAVYDSGLYLLGGMDSATMLMTNVYRFDGTNWTEVTGLPDAQQTFGAGTLDDTLYVFGGYCITGVKSNTYAYNGTAWSEVSGLRTATVNMAYSVYQDRLYSIGGIIGTYVTNVCAFDGTNWSATVGLPQPSGLGAAATLDDHLYMSGGTASGTVHDTAYRFDGTNWSAIACMPQALKMHKMARLGAHVYVAGGTTNTVPVTNVYRYPIITETPGVVPASGSWTGGYPVVINGTNLCNGGDITNVTLAGITVTSIDSQSPTQIIVTAASSPETSGDVVVQSISYGTTVKSNAFTYLEPVMGVVGTNGTAIASGEAASSVNGTDFGSLIVGLESATNIFSITNSGNTALHISGVTTSGTGASSFTLDRYPATVDSGAVEEFSVIFTPDSGGAKAAALTFANDGTNDTYVVNLAGFGSGGGIALSTNWLGFTATYGGSDPGLQVVTMDNVGVSSFNYSNSIQFGETYTNWLYLSSFEGMVPAPGSTRITNSVGIWGLNAGAYACTVTVSAADATNSPQSYFVTLDVGKADQTITFPHPGTQETTNHVGLAATAASGLPVSFNVGSGPGSIAGGTNLSFSGSGDVIVTASQAGNSNWNAAASVTHTIAVSKATAEVILGNLSQVYDGTARTVTSSTDPIGLTVNLSYDGHSWAPTNAGSYAITGIVSDVMYQGWKTDTLAVAKADQVITFPQIPDQTYTSRVGLAASASSGQEVYFFTNYGSARFTGVTNLYFTGTGAVSILAYQYGDGNWNGALATNNFMVFKADQVIDFPVIADQITTNLTVLTASCTSSGQVSFEVVSGEADLSDLSNLTYRTDGTVVVRALQPGSNYWNAAPPVTNTFNVTKAIGEVILSNLTQVYDGSPKYPSDQTDPSNLVVNLTFDGVTNRPINVGTYEVIGTMDDPMYQDAATNTFTIVQATQTISFAQLPDMVITNTWGLSATGGASSNLVTFAVLSGPASIAGTTNLGFSNVGEVHIIANQAGDSNYLAATTVTNIFNVSPVQPAIDSLTVSNIQSKTAALGATITSTNGAPVTQRGVLWRVDGSTNVYMAIDLGAFGTGAFSMNVTGIIAGVTNYYQAFARNVSGTVYTVESSFLARPDAPELTGATNIQAESFYANWNAAIGATNYYLDVSETNTFTSFIPGYNDRDVGNVLSVSVTGLGSSVYYYYRARSINASGVSTNSRVWETGLMMDLTINALPAEHDTPAPLGYGANPVIVNTIVTNTVTTPTEETNGVRYACTGWSGTGDVPATGTANTVTFLFAQDSTLTWHWKTQYELTQTASGGTIEGLTDGWKDEGWIFDLYPIANNGYVFNRWRTNGVNAGTTKLLTVVADSPVAIEAIFTSSAWDVDTQGTVTMTGYRLDTGSGLFYCTFRVCNPSGSGFTLRDRFLYAMDPDAMTFLDNPDGTSPTGKEYKDVTAEVKSKLQSVGNGDQIMDPGECVTLNEIAFWARNPNDITSYFYSRGTPIMTDRDTDGDGIPNDWEDQEGLNKNNPYDAGQDQDDDGVISGDEYIADTKPFDGTSYLHIFSLLPDPVSGENIGWIGGTGVIQYLEWTTNANDGSVWSIISTNTPPTPITNQVDVFENQPEGFYRIRAVR